MASEISRVLTIGFHISVSHGLAAAVDAVNSVGCNAMQMFIGNPRSYRPTFRTDEEIAAFRRAVADRGIRFVAVHASYLINLASADESVRSRSLDLIKHEYSESIRIGADAYVIHPGRSTSGDTESGIKYVIYGLKSLLSSLPDECTAAQAQGTIDVCGGQGSIADACCGQGVTTDACSSFGPATDACSGQASMTDHSDYYKGRRGCRILLENLAGAGSDIGSSVEELGRIIHSCEGVRFGICLDTCHAYAAGYDVARTEGLEQLLGEIDARLGLDTLHMVHLNDAKALGNNLDRHQEIGQGAIGLDGFRRIVNHPILSGLPFILETPHKDISDDERNVSAVKSLVE